MNPATEKLWEEIKTLGGEKSRIEQEIRAKRNEMRQVCDHTWKGGQSALYQKVYPTRMACMACGLDPAGA